MIRSLGHETCHHVTYLMTCEQFELLLARADGRCEICRIPTDQTARGKLDIDHDGRLAASAVRGLLCSQCNIHVKLVEAGQREVDERAMAYLAGAWHRSLTALPGSSERMATRTMRVEDDLWREFGAVCEATGSDRSAVIRRFMEWTAGVPGAKRPRRPSRDIARSAIADLPPLIRKATR